MYPRISVAKHSLMAFRTGAVITVEMAVVVGRVAGVVLSAVAVLTLATPERGVLVVEGIELGCALGKQGS